MTDSDIQPPYLIAVTTYLSFACLFIFGRIRDFFRSHIDRWLRSSGSLRRGYAPIRQDYEDFYTRRLYYRIHDCWNRPIGSAPDRTIKILDRTQVDGQKPLKLTGTETECLNLGSYNYLGFAAADEFCTPRVISSLGEYGWSSCSSRTMGGTSPEHVQLERDVARFLGKEDAIVLGMGFATNSMILPALVGAGDLVVSDALNHASIVSGVRGSGAKVRVFRHNDAGHLERVLRHAIAEGQPRTHRPWRKILVVVEGIYSMEGEMCNLVDIVAVKKRYKAYLYLDEAHSIGALGRTGRGVCEQLGVDTADVDVMMGTFTKSFGSCGGYVAAARDVVQHLRLHSPASAQACAMSPPVPPVSRSSAR
uniref:serine C-palmitoyltransferase n=1 Tax=Tetraselmis sp. GSL018 TaxID=582737 RepID=A0A061QT62_9CHLO